MSWRVLACLFLLAFLSGPPAAAQEYLWCYNQDLVLFDLNPQTRLLTIEHQAAMYNCCPEPVTYTVETVPGLITVTELVGAEPPCDCICCFTMVVSVAEVPPGTLTVRFTWLDEENDQWRVVEAQLVVPGQAGSAQPTLAGWSISDCLEVTPVPPEHGQGPSWSGLKAWYR